MNRVQRSRLQVAILLVVASCASVQPAATTIEAPAPPEVTSDSSEELAAALVQFVTSIDEALSGNDATSNSYSHQRLLGLRKQLGEPIVHLVPTGTQSAFTSTDCSGFLSFVLNTVSPLHEAVLQSQRRLPEYNRMYSEDFALKERLRPWSRAFVVTEFFRAEHSETTGFEPIVDFADLRAGDIGAYAMGRYVKPSDQSRPRPRDTGHVFIVVGSPTVVDSTTDDYDGRGTLSEKAVQVIALPVIDSTATVHFDPDSRKNEEGRYSLPEVVPHTRARPGGVGSGTIWFALNDEGRVLQRRLGPGQRYRPVLARAARLRGRIRLEEAVLDGSAALSVRVFDGSPSEFNGLSYGSIPVDISGEGGIRLASGRLHLNGRSSFSGGVTVESGELIVGSPTGLGNGDIAIRGGSMTLQVPLLAPSALLDVADDLSEGAIHLDFEGRGLVQALRIGGTIHRCGTWGGPESGAMFIDPVFVGPGILELVDEPVEACTPSPEEFAMGKKRKN